MVGDAARDRAHHVERVEGRHPRPGFGDVEPRIRQVQALAGGADRDLQQKALGRGALGARDERRARLRMQGGACRTRRERMPRRVEQHRILAQPLRKHALGEAGHEDDAERAAAHLVRAADEHAAVAPRRRVPVERQQPLLQHRARLLERHRPDRRHRSQVGEHRQHAGRPAEHAGRQRGHPIQPLAPARLVGPVGQRVDDWQRERTQVAQVAQVAPIPADARRLGLVATELVEAQSVVGGEPVEPAPPPALAVLAVAPRDDRRLDDELFPLPGRAQRAGHDRLVV